jgi:uncharacterized protein (TIGR02453 family)
MLQPATLSFLAELAQNNEKPWFDANRKAYQAAKTDIEQLANAVIQRLSVIDPSVAHLTAKDCIFRINRDIRFSNDKTPYKTNMGFWVARRGRKSADAGYYFHTEPGKSFLAAGVYMPMPPDLKKIRQEIAYCFDEFKGIVEGPDFDGFFGKVEIEGHSLVKIPAGYAADHPAAAYLKLKSYIGRHNLTDAEITGPGLLDTLAEGFAIAAPLVHFLNRGME